MIKQLKSDVASARNVTLFLFGIWLFTLLVMGILQLAGLHFGFKVWPLGEDRNWLRFMHDGPGLKMAHLFWQTDWRNPLSAWWWVVISPFVKASDWALYFVRKCVDPFLAIVTFLLLDKVGRLQCRTFAFSVALLVLFWNFSAYYEQILWDFDVALGFGLLAIYFYCCYLDTQRRGGFYLGTALICYLIAISTYTLQSGALIAIAYLAFFRKVNIRDSMVARCTQAFQDCGFFFAIFLIYNCIWYTASPYGDVYYTFDWKLFSSQLWISLSEFFYHSAYTQSIRFLRHDWSVWTLSFIFIVAFVFSSLVLLVARKRKIISTHMRFAFSETVMILAAIALPTVLVEATSTTWYPGTRSIMVQQVWQPLLYVFFIFLIVTLVFKKYPKILQTTILMSVAILTSVAILAGLNYNYRLVLRTHYQYVLVQALKKITIPTNIKPHFLIKLTDPNNIDLNTISIVIKGYAQSMMKDENVFVRTIQQTPYPTQDANWIIKFNNDKKGVINAALLADHTPVPYSDIWIVFFDGSKAWVPKTVNKDDLAGLQIDWLRDEPINQINKQD